MTTKELKAENEKLKKELESYKKTYSDDHIIWYHRENELLTKLDKLSKSNDILTKENNKLKNKKYDYDLLDLILSICSIKIYGTSIVRLFTDKTYDSYFLRIYKTSNYHQYIEVEISEKTYELLLRMGY